MFGDVKLVHGVNWVVCQGHNFSRHFSTILLNYCAVICHSFHCWKSVDFGAFNFWCILQRAIKILVS